MVIIKDLPRATTIRTVGWLLCAVVSVAMFFSPDARAQETVKVKVGFLHTVAVDGHLLVGEKLGTWKKHGLEFEKIQFNSGVPLAQALAGGSIDVGIMGSVLSNFPSRGQGMVFLANNIEARSVIFYANPKAGVKSIEDLKGKRVATVKGAAGQVVLQVALRKAGVSMQDVDIVNSDMPTAVNAFLSGSIPVLVTWMPFDVQVTKQMPDAMVIATGDKFYGPRAGLLGGWVASNSYYAKQRKVLERIAEAWLEINAYMIGRPDEVLRILHASTYSNVSMDQLAPMLKATQMFPNAEWEKMYRDGEVAALIGATQQVFIDIGAFSGYVDPAKFFDPTIFLAAYKSASPSARGRK